MAEWKVDIEVANLGSRTVNVRAKRLDGSDSWKYSEINVPVRTHAQKQEAMDNVWAAWLVEKAKRANIKGVVGKLESQAQKYLEGKERK